MDENQGELVSLDVSNNFLCVKTEEVIIDNAQVFVNNRM